MHEKMKAIVVLFIAFIHPPTFAHNTSVDNAMWNYHTLSTRQHNLMDATKHAWCTKTGHRVFIALGIYQKGVYQRGVYQRGIYQRGGGESTRGGGSLPEGSLPEGNLPDLSPCDLDNPHRIMSSSPFGTKRRWAKFIASIMTFNEVLHKSKYLMNILNILWIS